MLVRAAFALNHCVAYLRLRSREELCEVLAVCSQDRTMNFPDTSVALDAEVNITLLAILPHPGKRVSGLCQVFTGRRV